MQGKEKGAGMEERTRRKEERKNQVKENQRDFQGDFKENEQEKLHKKFAKLKVFFTSLYIRIPLQVRCFRCTRMTRLSVLTPKCIHTSKNSSERVS